MAGPSAPSDFSRQHGSVGFVRTTRVVAALLTGLIYAVFALLFGRAHDPAPLGTSEISTNIIIPALTKRAAEPLPMFRAQLIHPRAEKPALPVYTVATGAPPQSSAPLPASAVTASPMSGGTAGNGPMGQAASGNGTGGNGGALAGCLDPAWMRAVTDQVAKHFYYPQLALGSRIMGVVTVHFVVHLDGSVSGLEIAKSSGDDVLDKAASDIFHSALPLPPIPDRMHVEQVEGQLPINFGVRGYSGAPSFGRCK
jgi:TonB family protein